MSRKKSIFIIRRLFSIAFGLLQESLRFGRSLLRPRTALAAENLFLRKQLAFYQERTVKPRRLNDSARLSLLFWSQWFDWRNALVIVKPETFIGWHKRAFQIFWRWKSRGGRRPGIPDPPPGSPVAAQICRHAVSDGFSIKKKSILGGLHHEYRLERIAA